MHRLPRSRPAAPAAAALVVALGALAAVTALAGCKRERPAAKAPLHSAGTGAPTFSFEPSAVTYERENRNRWLQARVTVSNPTAAPVKVAWAELKAEAQGPLAGPTWHGDVLPELNPGEQVSAAVSWYYAGGEHPRPTTIRVRYAPSEFVQELPVTVAPTSGFTTRLSLPATAQNVGNPPPQPGQSWEVRVPVEIRNGTPGPLMLVPFWFEAVLGDQKVRHSGDSPAQLNAIQRLSPGESVRGALLWRFRGTGPAPDRVRIMYPSAEKPEFDQTIEVKPPQP